VTRPPTDPGSPGPEPALGLLGLLLPLLLCLGAAACDAPPDEAVVALVYPVSPEMVASVASDALEERRAPGGNGPRIRFEVHDIEAWQSLDAHLERAESLARRPEVVGVVGHGGSRPDLAAGPVYAERRIPHVSPSSTSRRLPKVAPSIFLLAPDNKLQGGFLARFAAEHLGAASALLFFVNDEYGTGLGEEIAAGLEEGGVELVDRIPVSQTNDPAPLLEAALREGPVDVVMVAARGEVTGTLARLIEERGLDLPVVAGDGAYNMEVLREHLAGVEAELYVAGFWFPTRDDPEDEAFVASFRELAGRDPTWAEAFAYDGLLLLATAAREEGADRERIRAHLEALGEDDPPYPGVTGPIAFNGQTSPPLMVARMTSTGFELVPFP